MNADAETPRPSPPGSDAPLDVALARFNAATGALTTLVHKERRRRRVANGIVAFLLLLGAYNYQHDKYTSCRSANEARATLHQGFEILTTALVPNGAPPSVVAQRDAFMATLRAKLPLRECRFQINPFTR